DDRSTAQVGSNLAGQRVLVLVRGPAMPRRGEGLIERDLHAGDLAAVEPAQGNRIAGRVGDAERFRHAELLGLVLRRVERDLRLSERKGLDCEQSRTPYSAAIRAAAGTRYLFQSPSR